MSYLLSNRELHSRGRCTMLRSRGWKLRIDAGGKWNKTAIVCQTRSQMTCRCSCRRSPGFFSSTTATACTTTYLYGRVKTPREFPFSLTFALAARDDSMEQSSKTSVIGQRPHFKLKSHRNHWDWGSDDHLTRCPTLEYSLGHEKMTRCHIGQGIPNQAC